MRHRWGCQCTTTGQPPDETYMNAIKVGCKDQWTWLLAQKMRATTPREWRRLLVCVAKMTLILCQRRSRHSWQYYLRWIMLLDVKSTTGGRTHTVQTSFFLQYPVYYVDRILEEVVTCGIPQATTNSNRLDDSVGWESADDHCPHHFQC